MTNWWFVYALSIADNVHVWGCFMGAVAALGGLVFTVAAYSSENEEAIAVRPYALRILAFGVFAGLVAIAVPSRDDIEGAFKTQCVLTGGKCE